MSSPSNAARPFSPPSSFSIRHRKLNSYSVFAAAAFAAIGALADPALAKKEAPREHVPFTVEHGRGASGAAPTGVRFEAFGRRFDLELERNGDLVAPGTRGWIVDANGRHSVDLPDVWIARSADGTSHGRLSFENGKPKGWVKSGGETWAIDPDDGAATVAVGSAAELLAAADPILCGSHEVAPGVSLAVPTASLRGVNPNPRIFEVAVVADAAFYRNHVGDAVGEILSILNGVDGIYRDDLGLGIQLVQLVVYRSEAVEPFNPVNNPEALLYEVGGARNMDPVLSVGNGAVTHLMTGRDFGSAAGIAFVGSVCDDFYAAGLSAVEGTSAYFDVVLVAHEIGHNLGAGHDGQPNSGGCDATGTGYVMWPILNGGVMYEFSPCSIGVIDSTVSGASCLATTTPSLCGNGNLDPGEFCDFGAPVVGSCCRVDCTYAEAGLPCGDSGDICQDAVCNGGGACVNVPNNESCPSPSVCEAAQCSGGSCQPVGSPSEFNSVSVSLHSRDGAVDGAKLSIESPLEHLGSTPCDDGVEVEISVGGTPYWSETIPPGSWVCKTNGKASYRALAPVPGQVKTMRVTYDEGHSRLLVKAKLVAPSAPFTAAAPTLHLLSGNNADGQCGTNLADVCIEKGANLVCE